jgi:8-oxo-dGTP pyrophosphatase MutT (NUDIX family)
MLYCALGCELPSPQAKIRHAKIVFVQQRTVDEQRPIAVRQTAEQAVLQETEEETGLRGDGRLDVHGPGAYLEPLPERGVWITTCALEAG